MAYVKCIRNLVSSTVPDGKTVTPTDDISIWLACGGRSETYTTLSQVLADSTCLSALINDNNAVDYLVRSTTWASDVCGDSGAMTAIGGNNYASNTLLADSTWCSAICNSTYFESVLNVKVPTMTSNTTPSGEVTTDAPTGSANAYKAFANYPYAGVLRDVKDVSANIYVGYIFPNKVKVHKLRYSVGSSGNLTVSFTFKGSEDGSNFTDLGTDTIAPAEATTDKYSVLGNTSNTEYKEIRFQFSPFNKNSSNYYTSTVGHLQIYGRADV